jgi:hypothetical protein
MGGRKLNRKVKDIVEAGGAHVILNAHLDKLSDAELDVYMRTGKLPPGWRLRKKKETGEDG